MAGGLLGAFGVLIGVTPFAASSGSAHDGRWFLAALGLALLATAVVVVVLQRPARAGGGVEAEAGGAVTIRLSARTPLTMVVIGTTFALLFVAAVLAVGVGEGGLLFTPLVVLFALLVPDGVRALIRDPGLRLTPTGLDYRGWTVDAHLDWDDVVSVHLDTSHPRQPRLRVAGHPEAASWSVASHRLLLPLDPVPSAPAITVLASALDHPTRLEVLARNLMGASAADRAALLGPDGVEFLSGRR